MSLKDRQDVTFKGWRFGEQWNRVGREKNKTRHVKK